MAQDFELRPEELRRWCDGEVLTFASTAEVPQLEEIFGQERATRAIEFGVSMRSQGYNVFVMGPPGAGKTTTVMEYLRRRAAREKVPSDWCYVYNFDISFRPRALCLPAGRGRVLQQAMERLIRSLREDLPRAFESDVYQEHISRLRQELDAARTERFRALSAFAEARGHALVRTPAGLAFVPYVDGRILSPEEFEKLEDAKKQELEAVHPELQAQLERVLRELRELERELREQLEVLDREVAANAVRPLLEPVREAFADCPDVQAYLDAVLADIQNNAPTLKESMASAAGRPGASAAGGGLLDRYRVNLLVDNSDRVGAPIVLESYPSYYNLLGRVEHRAEMGTLVTDHTMIRAGALHQANGGYLVVEAEALLRDPFAWEALKRCLAQREIRVESFRQEFSVFATAGLTPEPIPLDIKVVLIGPPAIYYLLYALDPDFEELFKVRADFGVDMDWNTHNIGHYARFISTRCQEERLPHFSTAAVRKIVEYGARVAGDQNKLTTRMASIVDIIRESAHWARSVGSKFVEAEHVQRAVDERAYRSRYVQDRLLEAIAAGTLVLETEGQTVGQINGLSVVMLGDYAFGKPSRITARVFMGRAGVVNIEREVKLSGPIHDKGVLILSGYLGWKYASQRPLSLSATIAFEQSYEGIEGDSASLAELYALLSALAEVPLRQAIAVTGAVDQQGHVLPVGAVTEKIEGFYEACRVKGLTGEQGVIIPRRNVRHLMLREDIVEAVRRGEFHVWAIDDVDDGVALLTGLEAGKPGPDGSYPDGSLHQRVSARLQQLAEQLSHFQAAAEGRTQSTE